MQHFDVIIAGAGPAGCAAAFELARGGAKVALVEKQPLPRHKTCGGGMPMLVSSVLGIDDLRDLDPAAFVEADTRFMRHTYRFEDPFLAPMSGPEDAERPLSLWMVQRSIFDNALASRAAAAGAVLFDSLAIKSLEVPASGAISVHADGRSGSWRADCNTVIGADGANGIVAKCVGLRKVRALAIALEAEVPHAWGAGDAELQPDIIHLDYGAVPQGYAWVFPKANHLNVGAGVFRPRSAAGNGGGSIKQELRTAILNYLTYLGVPKREEDLHFYAHPLPIWDGMERVQTRDGRVLLAGDAAGLINPFFGDGILHALKSGQIAARCILAGDLHGYSKAIAAEFRSNMDSALKLAKVFYRWPHVCYRHGVKRPGATRIATRLICGEAVFTGIARKAFSVLRRAMKAEGMPAETDS